MKNELSVFKLQDRVHGNFGRETIFNLILFGVRIKTGWVVLSNR